MGRIGGILLRMRLGSPTTPLLLPQARFVTEFLCSVLPSALADGSYGTEDAPRVSLEPKLPWHSLSCKEQPLAIRPNPTLTFVAACMDIHSFSPGHVTSPQSHKAATDAGSSCQDLSVETASSCGRSCERCCTSESGPAAAPHQLRDPSRQPVDGTGGRGR